MIVHRTGLDISSDTAEPTQKPFVRRQEAAASVKRQKVDAYELPDCRQNGRMRSGRLLETGETAVLSSRKLNCAACMCSRSRYVAES